MRNPFEIFLKTGFEKFGKNWAADGHSCRPFEKPGKDGFQKSMG